MDSPMRLQTFLLRLLVHLMAATALAELLQLQTFFDRLFVLMATVTDRFAFGTLQLDHVVLGHRNE